MLFVKNGRWFSFEKNATNFFSPSEIKTTRDGGKNIILYIARLYQRRVVSDTHTYNVKYVFFPPEQTVKFYPNIMSRRINLLKKLQQHHHLLRILFFFFFYTYVPETTGYIRTPPTVIDYVSSKYYVDWTRRIKNKIIRATAAVIRKYYFELSRERETFEYNEMYATCLLWPL